MTPPPGACTVGAALAAARARIGAVDAAALLRHVLACDAAYLLAHDDEPIPAARLESFEALVAGRAAGEPVAYLAGHREFYGRDFRVTPAVLIPRPETELLVELALAHVPADRAARVLDLGTGSGCIAISIALARPRARVVAADRADDALAVARDNANRLGAAGVEFRQGDWYGTARGERYDLIVSNPPYVADGDPHLAQGDLRHEPLAALASGADGLAAIRVIAAGAPAHLESGGWLLVEHGYDQAERCRALFAQAGFADCASHADLAGIARVTAGRKS